MTPETLAEVRGALEGARREIIRLGGEDNNAELGENIILASIRLALALLDKETGEAAYRMLEVGETLQVGDECGGLDFVWSSLPESCVGEILTGCGNYRRPLK